MKLIVKCNECRTANLSPVNGSTRIKIVQKFGEEFQMTCSNCGKTDSYEVDDVRAEDYTFWELFKNWIFVYLVIALASFVLSYLLLGIAAGLFTSMITTVLAALIYKSNSSKRNLIFNKHKVKRRMTNIGS